MAQASLMPGSAPLSVRYANINLVPKLGSGVSFVAREAELRRLRAAVDSARTGTAGVVVIAGDAGVGKTRLLGEVSRLAEAAGFRELIGRCLGIGEAGLPYLPFKEIVQQMRVLDESVVASRPPLATTAGIGAPSAPSAQQDLGQLQLFDAVLAAVGELSDEQPLLIQFEDLHWSDPSTRDLLSFLVSRLSTQRVLVVMTYRSDDLHRRHPLRPFLAEIVRLPVVERLELGPLGLADSRSFVRALADDALDEAIVSAVAERSEGNAFFAEELLAAGATSGSALPTALADVLLTRVEQLSSGAQRVVGAASVTGRRRVRHETLRTVLGIDETELDAALREAVQQYILVPGDDDAYAFRHALLREAIYADLLPGERVRLHAAYAKLLRDDDNAGLSAALAHHSLRSNDLATALVASVRAGDEAMQVGALGAELRHVEQALELWHAVDEPEQLTGVDELALMRKATYVANAAGHPERALAFARAAASLTDATADPVTAADVRRVLAQTLLTNGRWDDAEAVIIEAWQLIRDLPPSVERAWVLSTRARSYHAGDNALERAYAEEALADARASGSAEVEADALISLAFSVLRDGDTEEAGSLLVEARERAVEAKAPGVELRAYFNLVVTRYEQGHLDVAAEIADAGDQRAAELGLTWSPYGLEVRWMRAMVHYARGSWRDAAFASSPPGEDVSDTITALLAACRVMVKVAHGEFDDARRVLERLRPEWHRDSQIAQLAAIAGTELACWTGAPELATTIVDDALDSMRKTSSTGWPMGGIRLATLALGAQADLASRARLRHDVKAERTALDAGLRLADYARTTAERGAPRGAELGPEGRAWLAYTEAEESRLRGADDPTPWRAVVDAFGYGEIYQMAKARLRLAEALLAGGDRDAATAEATAALATAQQLEARPLAQALREFATRARLALPGVRATTADVLTPREHAVLEQVARGLTNRQVGEQLFISEKTVSVHVSRVMAKLEAASRTEAVAVAYQRGLLDPAGAAPTG